MNVITIHYKARIEWFDYLTGKMKNEMCNVTHKVNTIRMETMDLTWEPLEIVGKE